MSDRVIHNVLGLVMAYDDGLHQWQPCGNQQQFANIYILYNEAAKIYRFYGIDSSDGEVVLDSEIYQGLKYNKATPIFHQWRDSSRRVYGVKFNSTDDADSFSEALLTILDSGFRSQRRSVDLQSGAAAASAAAMLQQYDQPTKLADTSAGSGQYSAQPSVAAPYSRNDQPSANSANYAGSSQPNQSAMQYLWSSQQNNDQPGYTSNGTSAAGFQSRIYQAEPAPAQNRLTQAAPVLNQSRNSQLEPTGLAASAAELSSVVQAKTPQYEQNVLSTRAAQAEPAQGKWSPQKPATTTGQAGFGTLQRQSSQPTYDQYNDGTSAGSLPAGDENQPIVARNRSSSYGNALDDAINSITSALQTTVVPSSQEPVPVPAANVAPVPPPPPPPPMMNAPSLADALKSSTLRKTNKPPDETPGGKSGQTPAGGTLSRATGRGGTGVDMMSEMARKLEARRAKTADSDGGGSAAKPPQTNGQSTDEKPTTGPSSQTTSSTPVKAPAPLPASSGKDSPRLERKWQSSSTSSHASTNAAVSAVTAADLENLKKELTNIVRSEIASAKQDIIDAVAKMLNR